MEVKVKFNEINIKEEKYPTIARVLMLKGDPGTTNYNDLTNKPTKLSDFENDGVFITNTADDLTNYYNKSATDTLLSEKVDKTSVAQTTGSSTTSIMSQDAVTTQLGNKATTSLYNATLGSSGWSSTVPYTQTVSVSGILSTDTPIADVVLDSDTPTAISQISAWACVSKIETSNGSITATCLETKPTINIPIQLKVVR